MGLPDGYLNSKASMYTAARPASSKGHSREARGLSTGARMELKIFADHKSQVHDVFQTGTKHPGPPPGRFSTAL